MTCLRGALFVLVALVAPVALGCAPVDLRSGTLAQLPKEEAASRDGRPLLEAAAQRAGLEAWRQRQTVEVVFRDDWDSLLASLGGAVPWDEEDKLGLRYTRGGFEVRAEFLEGPRAGEVQHFHKGQPWHKPAGADAAAPVDDENIRFYMPTYPYLVELHFRLLEAPILIEEEPAEFEGVRYRRVFATWGSAEPTRKIDQYIAWVHPETGRVDLCDFTVRDVSAGWTGRVLYREWREVEGVSMPTRFSLVEIGEGTGDGYVHDFRAESITFDGFPASALAP